jgi:hypothetical protein
VYGQQHISSCPDRHPPSGQKEFSDLLLSFFSVLSASQFKNIYQVGAGVPLTPAVKREYGENP